MSEELKLTLPERKKPAGAVAKLSVLLLALVLLTGLANIALTLRQSAGRAPTLGPATLPSEAQKALALKLEKQGISEQAVSAWEEYLDAASLDGKEQAAIWYRIGKLQQDEGDYAQALDSYYRSESFNKTASLEADIGRRAQECLESLGKFAALRYELTERTSLGETAPGEEVLAEIGPQKITRADLDRRIEAEVDRQFEQYAAFLPAEERNQQKEAILKGLRSSEESRGVLSQIIQEEVLYRRARELKFMDKAAVRDMLRDMERKVMAQKVVESELAAKVNITETDVQTYYKANQGAFAQKPRVRIAHILLDSEDQAREALARLEGGVAFEDAAKELSKDAATREQGGAVEAWIEQAAGAPQLGLTPEALAPLFTAGPGKLLTEPIESPHGFHLVKLLEREEARQRPYEEARQEAYRALRTQKEQEVQTALLRELTDTYDVVIHSSQFGAQTQDEGDAAQQPT